MSGDDSNRREIVVSKIISAIPRKRGLRDSLISIIVGVSGFILILAKALPTVGIHSLSFLVSDFGILHLPQLDIGLLVIAIGIGFIAVGAGLWRLRKWAFALGLILSLIDVVISVFAHDFTSFTFIRGVIVLVYLLRVRHDFS